MAEAKNFSQTNHFARTDHIRVRVMRGTACALAGSYFDDNRKRSAPSTNAPQKQGVVMIKFAYAVLAAAAIAGAFTFLTAASDRLDAGPLSATNEAVLKDCTQRPWPYLNCVGTPLGNQHIRLITTERL